MTEAAEALLKEAEARPDSAQAGIAHRINGVTRWIIGDDIEIARDHLQKALVLYRPERDRELAHRFAQDIGVAAMVYLSLVEWIFGQNAPARALMTRALALAEETNHVPTRVYAHYHAAAFEMICGDPAAAKHQAEAGLAPAREHGLKLWNIVLPSVVAWSNACSDRTALAWEEMRRLMADYHAQGLVSFGDLLGRALLAQGFAEVGRIEDRVAIIDQTIAQSERLGLHSFDAESHRIRGEILSKRDPANTAPAEEAFLTAIAVAQQQKARSFEVRAALALAKLYQSTNRGADAHAVLAPALEGFAPTPEFPEIEQAQMLLAALAPHPSSS
jgi:predicted ATPase